jgi:hypothetical protein
LTATALNFVTQEKRGCFFSPKIQVPQLVRY